MAKKSRPTVKRPLTSDELGRAGQTDFGGLLDRGKLIATDSSRADRMGWDYHVEMPFDASRGTEPFDKRHKVPDMKIQVKTIWSDNDLVNVELIAAERLARWEYPSFIAILRMNMDKTYKDLYLVHLLDGNLARILKTLREAEAQNARSIKNRKMTFNISSGVKITPDGDELAEALRKAIGGDGRAYAARKRDQLDNLGYSVNRVSGRFTLCAKDHNEVLSVFLGVQPGEYTKIEADEIRFNIPTPILRGESGRIEFKPASRGPCQFVISSPVDQKRAVFDAELYFASVGGPGSAWKIRVASDLIELIASRDAPHADFRMGIASDGRCTLDEMVLMTQAHLIMASGTSIAVIRKLGGTLLTFDVAQQTRAGSADDLRSKFKFFAGFRDLMAELGFRNMRLSDDDIKNNIGAAHFVLRTQKPNNGAVITLTAKLLDHETKIPDIQDGLFASTIWFPDATLAFWARMKVTLTRKEDMFDVRCSDFVLRDIASVDGDEGFEAWVQDASIASGLDFIVRGQITFDGGISDPSVLEND